mmetsp:Transcript_108569/g.151705  ORF Transcript_108569/g.151705 Transcript_108569/m.151705 type:complete len:209 (-) Transcript_108569:176-802(-)
MLLLEDLHEVLHHALVEVFSTQVGVAVGGHHLKDAVVDGEEGDIKGSTAEVVHKDVLLRLLVQTVCDGCSSGLVDDTQHVQAGNHTSILGGLALGVVEVRWDSDHSVLHLAGQVRLGDLLHLLQNHGGDLLRGELLGLALERALDQGLLAGAGHHLEGEVLHVSLNVGVRELAADQTLGVEHSVAGVHGGLVLGSITDQALGLRESHV